MLTGMSTALKGRNSCPAKTRREEDRGYRATGLENEEKTLGHRKVGPKKGDSHKKRSETEGVA